MMFPVANSYFRGLPLFENFPYLKRGRIISDPTTLKQKIVPEIKSWFPVGKYQSFKMGKDYDSYFITDTGFEFDLLSYEQETTEFESVDLGWAWFDEPPPEEKYKATVSRMRRGGIIFITATPLTGSAWLYDDIFTNQEIGKRVAIEADIEENCIEHGIRGILRHDDILKMIEEYDDEDKQARIFGKFQHLTGLVFKKFKRETHVIKPFNVSIRDYTVYNFLDCHPRVEDHVSWVAVDRHGEKTIVDELKINVEQADELAQRIKQRDAQFRIGGWFADPSAWVEDQHKDANQKSLALQLANLGLVYAPASKERSMAIRLTRDALDYQLIQVADTWKFKKPPMLFCFDTCQGHIWEFEHWQYNEYTGKTSESRGVNEKPRDKDDHFMENVGRAMLADIQFVPYRDPREERGYNSDSDRNELDPYE